MGGEVRLGLSTGLTIALHSGTVQFSQSVRRGLEMRNIIRKTFSLASALLMLVSCTSPNEMSVGTFAPTSGTWGQITEITSERSFVVEVIRPRTSWGDNWLSLPRDYGGFQTGDIVEVKFDEYDRWVLPVIEDLIEEGTIVEFHRESGKEKEATDFTQEPFTTWAVGLIVYAEDVDNEWHNSMLEDGLIFEIELNLGLKPIYDNPYFRNRYVS
jgi:hypothetical protein